MCESNIGSLELLIVGGAIFLVVVGCFIKLDDILEQLKRRCDKCNYPSPQEQPEAQFPPHLKNTTPEDFRMMLDELTREQNESQ